MLTGFCLQNRGLAYDSDENWELGIDQIAAM
jgi:hypothetical protein